jgi:hypothetical protein
MRNVTTATDNKWEISPPTCTRICMSIGGMHPDGILSNFCHSSRLGSSLLSSLHRMTRARTYTAGTPR